MVHEVEVEQNEKIDISSRQGAIHLVKIFAIGLRERRKARLRNLPPHTDFGVKQNEERFS